MQLSLVQGCIQYNPVVEVVGSSNFAVRTRRIDDTLRIPNWREISSMMKSIIIMNNSLIHVDLLRITWLIARLITWSYSRSRHHDSRPVWMIRSGSGRFNRTANLAKQSGGLHSFSLWESLWQRVYQAISRLSLLDCSPDEFRIVFSEYYSRIRHPVFASLFELG